MRRARCSPSEIYEPRRPPRVLLNAPDWVFLDEATSALDADMEKRVYGLLAERLPHTTVVSVLHRPELAAYHTRHLRLATTGHGGSSLQAAR